MIKVNISADDATPEVIAEAALDILKREGPAALSFRRVADELGIGHVTVYRRCSSSFDGLLDLCTDQAAAALPEVTATDWQAATEEHFLNASKMLTEHVDLLVLLRGRSWLGPNIIRRFYEPTMKLLIEAGMAYLEAGQFFSELHWLTVGHVLGTQATPWTHAETMAVVERVGSEATPYMTRVGQALVHTDTADLYRSALRKKISDAAAEIGTARRSIASA